MRLSKNGKIQVSCLVARKTYERAFKPDALQATFNNRASKELLGHLRFVVKYFKVGLGA